MQFVFGIRLRLRVESSYPHSGLSVYMYIYIYVYRVEKFEIYKIFNVNKYDKQIQNSLF